MLARGQVFWDNGQHVSHLQKCASVSRDSRGLRGLIMNRKSLHRQDQALKILEVPAWGSWRVRAALGCTCSDTIKQTGICCNKAAYNLATFVTATNFWCLCCDKGYRCLFTWPLYLYKNVYGRREVASLSTLRNPKSSWDQPHWMEQLRLSLMLMRSEKEEMLNSNPCLLVCLCICQRKNLDAGRETQEVQEEQDASQLAGKRARI